MPELKVIFIGFGFFLFIGTVEGQTILDTRISAVYEEYKVKEILQSLESDYSVRFFFKEEQLPNEEYTFRFESENLGVVLNQLLEDTKLGYFLYRNYGIIIASKELITQEYSAEYYRVLKNRQNLADSIEQNKDKRLVIGEIEKLDPSGKANIGGVLLDAETEQPIVGATVQWPALELGTTTDQDGRFNIRIPAGEHTLTVDYIGYESVTREVIVQSDGMLELLMDQAVIDLEQVTVEAEAPDANLSRVQIGVAQIDVQTIQKLPSFLGEADVIKSLLLQPGVSAVGDGALGFNVRGGEADQNLVAQDEGFLFNTAHALGFFSTFNTDLVKTVTLYKGNIPAQYGGRLASVLKVELRDGNFEQFKLKGGVGPVSSRVSLEGPIVKGESSFLAGFRSSYSDWVLDAVQIPEVNRSSAFFYDANFKYTHRINGENTILFSGYSSQDEFSFNDEFGFEYRSLIGQLIYKKIFSDRLFAKFSAITSQYQSEQLDLEGVDASTLENDIIYHKFKAQFSYTVDQDWQLDAGLSSILYQVDPGNLRPEGELSLIDFKELDRERGLESAIFLDVERSLSERLTVIGGIRWSIYQFFGPHTLSIYDSEQPASGSLIEERDYGGGEIVENLNNLEPRFSLRYRLNATSSIKGGYSRTVQYLNQISNTSTPTPSSRWQLSTPNILPQKSHNFSVGYFRNFRNDLWETSAEVYYRAIDQLFDFKDFADLAINEDIETQLLSGIGRAYGMEWSIKKKRGGWHGWLSYTLSRIERQVAGISEGQWFPGNFDKPHDLSLVLNFQPNQRHTITINFNYSTGRPTTAPFAAYREINSFIVPVYSKRNQVRIPDYHRLDLAYTLGQGYKKNKKIKTSWTFSLYNVYGRRNAFNVFFTQQPFQPPKANQLAILGSIFPALTFNLETI